MSASRHRPAASGSYPANPAWFVCALYPFHRHANNRHDGRLLAFAKTLPRGGNRDYFGGYARKCAAFCAALIGKRGFSRVFLGYFESSIDHLRRGPASNVTNKLAAAPPGSVYFCSVVLAELIYGALHSGAANQTANMALIAKLRQQFPSLPFDDRAAEEYGKIRAHLAVQGTPIGPNDLMIAAIAVANQMILVTHNIGEFSRVPNLMLETWH